MQIYLHTSESLELSHKMDFNRCVFVKVLSSSFILCNVCHLHGCFAIVLCNARDAVALMSLNKRLFSLYIDRFANLSNSIRPLYSNKYFDITFLSYML